VKICQAEKPMIDLTLYTPQTNAKSTLR
jgi:hypothetical protein